MNIRIQNLGTIRDATIDLSKKLTVFCGPNNTGKTYVAYIIYALITSNIARARSLSGNQVKDFFEKGKLELKIDIKELCSFRTQQLQHIKSNLDSIFGIPEERAKSYFGNFEVSDLTLPQEFESKILADGFTLEQRFLNNITIKIIKKPNSDKVSIENLSKEKIVEKDINFVEFLFSFILYKYLAFYPNTTSAIFPVERNSIYTFSKELSITRNALIDQMQNLASNKKQNPFDFLFKRSMRYPLAIRDGLQIANDMENLQKYKSPYYAFADKLEAELLQGKISISRYGEMLFAPDKAKTIQLPIHLTASVVKTLTSLTFYLRYLAEKNDLIIIDEPELNLHPDSQIFLTRIFAQMLNRGLRLLVSTHSDYIIRELNNLIMLSNTSPAVKNKAVELNYKEDESIPFDEVNAYLFNYKGRGKVTVKSVPVSESGFKVETIDSAIKSLNYASEELYYAMKYGEDKE